jgi:large subunit ribosomal protein L32
VGKSVLKRSFQILEIETMPVPKYRKSRAKRDKRRSHDFLVAPNTTSCDKCGAPILPHRVCDSCGFYKGKKIMEIEL